MTGAIDPALRKFHTSLNVSDLARSVAFYRTLLGAEPAKVRGDYAKFDLAEPPLVLSLIPGRAGAGGPLNHVGLRVRNAEELVDVQRRLEAAGMSTRREDGVACCHSRQTKFWITDPDGILWEIYVFHEDIDEAEDVAAARVQSEPAEQAATQALHTWQHHLREPIPDRLPFDDNTLHQVRLEGSINLAPDAVNRSRLMGEVLRVLRPGAEVHVHGLAGDRPCSSAIALPGPAAAVQHVPPASDVAAELAAAGFAGIHLERLSSTAYFEVDGVPMRELQLSARKPGFRPRAAAHQAIYLGPMHQVVDDFGNVFTRGVPTSLNVHDWQLLSRGAMSSSFLLLTPAESKDGGCGDQPVTFIAGRTARR